MCRGCHRLVCVERCWPNDVVRRCWSCIPTGAPRGMAAAIGAMETLRVEAPAGFPPAPLPPRRPMGGSAGAPGAGSASVVPTQQALSEVTPPLSSRPRRVDLSALLLERQEAARLASSSGSAVSDAANAPSAGLGGLGGGLVRSGRPTLLGRDGSDLWSPRVSETDSDETVHLPCASSLPPCRICGRPTNPDLLSVCCFDCQRTAGAEHNDQCDFRMRAECRDCGAVISDPRLTRCERCLARHPQASVARRGRCEHCLNFSSDLIPCVFCTSKRARVLSDDSDASI